MGAWHWFASRKAENLWEAAGKHGYLSASVAFPTSVAAGGDFIAPEFWWDGTELDSRFIDAMSVPQGMILESGKGHWKVCRRTGPDGSRGQTEIPGSYVGIGP